MGEIGCDVLGLVGNVRGLSMRPPAPRYNFVNRWPATARSGNRRSDSDSASVRCTVASSR